MREARSALSISIICTLGPASLDHDVIRELDVRGVDLFRINLSHTRLADLEATIDFIRRCSDVPICLDTEGPQVRCGPVVDELLLEPGAKIELVTEGLTGTADRMSLLPASVVPGLHPGDRVCVDFNGAVLRVLEAGTAVRAIVEHGGRVGSNKAVTVLPAPSLPGLTDKDVRAMAIGARKGVEHYALSFAASADDVARARQLIPPSAHLVSKIESAAGVRNMDGIIQASDEVLIDRGDLSREVPLEHVPYVQKAIVRRANRWRKPLFVATNLLESMIHSDRPTIAEVNDIANTLLDGVHGLVLAAETAVGSDPVGAVDMVKRTIEAFEREYARALAEHLEPATTGSHLVTAEPAAS
jgi:pyruvate kinase